MPPARAPRRVAGPAPRASVTTLHADWQAARDIVYGAMGCEPVYEDAYGQRVEQPLVAAIVARYGVDWADKLSPESAQTMLRSWVY